MELAQARTPGSGSRRPIHFILLLLILFGAGVLRGRFISEPFGEGFRGVNGTVYYGQFVRHHLRNGLGATKGGLVLQSWPGIDEGMVRDFNHPPLPSWLFSAVVAQSAGTLEFRYRLLPWLASMLMVLGVFLVARRVLPPWPTLAATLLAAASPMQAFFGVMAVPDTFLPALACFLLLATNSYATGRCGLIRPLSIFILGTLFDWEFFFLAPAAWVTAWIARGTRSFSWKLLWLFPAGVASFALFLVHSSWIIGGWQQLLDTIRASGRTALGGEGYTLLEWLERQKDYMVEWFGWPPLLLLVLFVCMSVMRSRASSCRPAFASVAFFVTLTALSMGIFHTHAWGHPFWAMPLGPALYLAAAAVVHSCTRGGNRLQLLVSILIVLGMAALGTWKTLEAQDETRTTRYRDEAAQINKVTTENDVILTPELWFQQVFYVEARAFPNMRTRELIEERLEAYQKLGLRCRILVFLPIARVGEDPEHLRIVEFIAPFCPPPSRVGRFRVYAFTP